MTTLAAPRTPEAERARVLVVEADGPARLGLVTLLEEQPWIERCLIADDRAQAASLTRDHGPDVALVNVTPFVVSIVDTIRAAHRATQIVLVSRCPGAGTVLTRQVRAVGFLPPETTGDEVLQVTRRAALPSRVPRARRVSPPPAPAPLLSSRELQVLTLLTTGATNREIAEELNLGLDSVKKYATGIYRKLGVRNRTEATLRMASVSAPSTAQSAVPA